MTARRSKSEKRPPRGGTERSQSVADAPRSSEAELRQRVAEMGAVLDVNRAVARRLERDELFGALAHCLRSVVEHDRFGIELPIPGDRLQGHLLTPEGPEAIPTRIKILPRQGTACDWVLQHRQWLVAGTRDELRSRFPLTVEVMEHEGMQSLVALPLITGGEARAVLYFMSATRGAYAGLRRELVEHVAAAVAAALDNCLTHEALREESRQALAASEERFRDLFDEAPIAYVLERTDTSFVRVNHTGMRILGITPGQVAGSYGKDFVPDTPEAQDRLKQALTAIGSGQGASGVVLELRRRDNGKPIFIQWWTRPDPASGLTRTMFIDITDRVLMEKERARLEAQNVYLQEEIRSQHNFTEIVGNSPALLAVLHQVDQVAGTDATVLIDGETGTGKELIARAIHDRSPRRDRPLVKVNCGAISAGLVESELFGHVKGAFTGAIAHRDGRFTLADGGTIFLDEVGELPLDTQVKLLRVLQEQEFEPLGSSKTVKVDVRVIAATNRDLPALIREGKFRNDLYYRLNVFPMTMPPLRERADDIPLLTMFFLEKFARRLGRPIQQVAGETMRQLCAYAWPGNIRELQNVIERAVVLTTDPILRVEASALPTATPRPLSRPPDPQGEAAASRLGGDTGAGEAPSPSDSSMESVEREHILAVLEQTRWRIEGAHGAAKALNLQPSTLRSRMQKLGLKR